MSKVKTNVWLPQQTYNVTLRLLNQNLTINTLSSPTKRIYINALGSAEIAFDEDLRTVLGPAPDDPPSDPPVPGYVWVGVYWVFKLTITAPGETPSAPNTATVDLFIWTGTGTWVMAPQELPDGWVSQTGSMDINVRIEVTGVYMKAETNEEAIYSNGGIMAFVERSYTESWFADENASVTVTAVGPSGEQLSVSGPLAEAGQEVEFAAGWKLNFGWTIHRYDYEDVVYAAVSDIAICEIPLDLGRLDLYRPGSNVPDSTQPEWGRTKTQDDCCRVGQAEGGAATWREGEGCGGDISWRGAVGMPVHVHFKPRTHKHADDVDYPDILVTGTPINWQYDEESGTYVSVPVQWTGELEVVQQEKSWEFDWEWRTLSSLKQFVNVVRDWQKDHGEDVGSDDDPNLNAQACPLLTHPRSVSNLEGDPTEEWGTGVTVSHEGEKAVFKPPDVSRPGNWTGSGGLTPDASVGDNNDIWHVAAGSTAPTATMVIRERKTSRLARVVAQDPDLPSEMKHRNLIILNRANVDTWTEGGSDYLDPEDERYPEHIWHWMNYSYAKLRIKAPMSGTIRMTVDYKYPMIFDPGYPTLEPGELTVDWIEKTVVYEGHVEKTPEGADYSEVVFDLACPKEGEIAPRLYLVTRVTLQLPPHTEDLTWEIDDLYLLPSYVDGSWGVSMPPWFQLRVYDPWDFLSDYTMFAGLVGGVKCLDIPYGWEELERYERSLKGRRKWRSRNEEVYFMDHSRPLSELASDLSWQEGWQATYHEPEESTVNKDEDGNKLFPQFYWWDLLRSHEYTANPGDTIELKLCPIVRYWEVVAGIKHVIYYEKFFQGRIHGIVVKTDRSGRIRKDLEVEGYRRPSEGGEWAKVDETPVDGHGRYRLGPYLEKGYDYKVSVNSNYITGVANARYSWISGTGIVGPVGGAISATGPLTEMVHIAYTDNDNYAVKHLFTSPGDQWFIGHIPQVPYEQPNTVVDAPAQGLALYHDMSRRLHLFTVEDGTIIHYESQDWGKTWVSQTMVTTIKGQAVAATLLAGITTFLFVVDEDNKLVCYRSCDHFKTHCEGPWTVTTGVDAVQPACYNALVRLYVYCFKDGTLYCYRSDDAGKTWVEVGSA